MQNKLIDKPKINLFKNKFQKKLKFSDIEKFYLNSMKTSSKFGLEYERLSLDKNTGKCADYANVAKIIENFAEINHWEIIYDEETIIGAKSNDNCSISLEPGMQIEISLKPMENISDIDLRLTKITSELDKIADIYNIIFLPYGINPSQTPDEIELLNKRRYKIMNNYLPNCQKAELCTTMMRKTAGIQVNLDYSSKRDAYLKLKFYNLISPFMAGLSANSPFENNTISENKSNRINVWLSTGENRCNLFYQDIFSHFFKKYDNVFKNYINCVLDVPMVYIERDEHAIPINGLVTFREYMKFGFTDYQATMEDYILHQSLCFPDVRLKQYIEIRNHDSNKIDIALMLCALYKGLAKTNTETLLKKFDYLKIEKTETYFKNASRYGLDFRVNNSKCGWDVILELFNTARKKLDTKERYYLKPLENLLKFKKTSADFIQESNILSVLDLINFVR